VLKGLASIAGDARVGPMIVRVSRLRIKEGHEARVLEAIRATSAGASETPGLRGAWFGRSIDDDGSWLVAITEWDELGAIQAAFGNDTWTRGTMLPGLEDTILDTTVQHYEATLEDVTALVERRRGAERVR
jgi:heme-degrading monooxygenase HmoA